MSKRITFRVSENDFSALQKIASETGVNVSDYCRGKIFDETALSQSQNEQNIVSKQEIKKAIMDGIMECLESVVKAEYDQSESIKAELRALQALQARINTNEDSILANFKKLFTNQKTIYNLLKKKDKSFLDKLLE